MQLDVLSSSTNQPSHTSSLQILTTLLPCLTINYILKYGVHTVYYIIIIYIYIYPDTAKHQGKPQVYISDIAPCGQI